MKQLSLFIVAQFFCLFGFSQDGTLDPTFVPGVGPNSYLSGSCVMPDGKIVLVGEFTSYQGVSQNYITRTNSDGTIDPTFNIGTGALNSVYACAAQTDGKVVIGGNFTNFNGTVINRIARLNANGSLDATFNVGSGATGGPVTVVTIQADGKIIVAGQFLGFNGAPADRIVRLNTNGTVDATFNVSVDGPIRDIALQSDGKIVLAGNFFTCNGTNRRGVAKLNADGTIVTGFDPGVGPNNTIRSVSLLPNGKVICGGDFNLWNNFPTGFLIQLNTDGTVDASLNLGDGFSNWVYTTAVQTDGKIIAGGSFTSFSGIPTSYLTRLNSNGTIDNTWNPSETGTDFEVYTSELLSDGNMMIGGYFSNYNGVSRNYVARLLADHAALSENGSLNVDVYPNPTSGVINLHYNSPVDGTVRILDMTGNVILEREVSGQQLLELELNEVSGVYLLEITTAETSEYFRIIKQ